MTTPPNVPEDSLDPFAPRTPHIVGRETYVQAICDAIDDPDRSSHALYFIGPGGIGKTRLLEHVGALRHEQLATPFQWAGIIDLYHAEYHSPDGLRDTLADRLDPDNNYFHTYRQSRADFERKVREGIAGSALEEARRQLDPVFLQDYIALAQQQRLVLCFDTLELIQYESDIVQEICQIQDVDMVIKNWFLEQVSRFPNTIVLLASRPPTGRTHTTMQDEFAQRFATAGWHFTLLTLTGFTEEETRQYLDSLRMQRPMLDSVLMPDIEQWIYRHTPIRPIYLTLLLDLLLHGDTLPRMFPATQAEAQLKDQVAYDTNDDDISKQLVERLLNLPLPYHEMIYFLMHARKGLDVDLLRYLAGDSWSKAQIQEYLERVREFAFVKTRPGTSQMFLHDEIYDLCDLYFKDDSRYGHEYNSIAQYYRQRLEHATSPQEREDIVMILLYYELQVNAYAGYYRCYARWDEEAIKSHESGFDMHLRDEVLRFMDRYARPDSPFYTQRIAQRIDLASIDRDSAVRWVKRYQARGEHITARQIAENIRYSKHSTFNWDTVDDVLYKAGLAVAWGTTLVLTSAPEKAARSQFEQAAQLLENGREWSEDERWWRSRILGWTYNNLGYLYRTRGRYGIALQQYRRAIPFFKDANIPDERADTLNNLAFLLALLGRVDSAEDEIEQALRIRQEIGRLYPIALGYNTQGIIYTLEDHPLWGMDKCREALRICEDLQEHRGIGLAYNGLGFALRKRGDQWKKGVCSSTKAEEHFQEAAGAFHAAAHIFSTQVREPIRIWEAYNELGSLYCDWGWLTRHGEGGAQTALEQYTQSIEYQKQALTIAQEHDLHFPIADSYDDLAQVYSDRSFLLTYMGRTEEARESRRIAESYLDQIFSRVPQMFSLVSGEGFRAVPEPGEAYWLSLGKAHLWRGIWAFRDLEAGIVPAADRDQALVEATRELMSAVAYFQRYWQASFALKHTLGYFRGFLRTVGVTAEWAHEQIRTFAIEYRIDLKVLDDAVDDTLGL